MNHISSTYIHALLFWLIILVIVIVILYLAFTQKLSAFCKKLSTKKYDLSKENLNNSMLIVIANVALIAFLLQTLISSIKEVLISKHVYLFFGLIHPYLFVLSLVHIVLFCCSVYVMAMTGIKFASGLAASNLNHKVVILIIVIVLFFSVVIGSLSIN